MAVVTQFLVFNAPRSKSRNKMTIKVLFDLWHVIKETASTPKHKIFVEPA